MTLNEFRKETKLAKDNICSQDNKDYLPSILSSYVLKSQDFTLDNEMNPIEIDVRPTRRERMDFAYDVENTIVKNPPNLNLDTMKNLAVKAVNLLEEYVDLLDSYNLLSQE